MKLGGNYAVHLRKDGELHAFLPGDDVPEWAAQQITNPLAWGTAEESAEPVMITLGEGGSGGGGGGQGRPVPVQPDDGPPPQRGAGATRQRWADYATPLLREKGVEVQDDWKREDIIDACEKAGIEV